MNYIVTIIVPIYNNEKHIKKCLDSLLSQTYKFLEIVLVDDGSTDSSLKICNQYMKKDDRVIVVQKQNEGVASARNEGIKIAKGNFLVFVDSDDYIENNMIESLLDMVNRKDSDLGICNYFYNNVTKLKEDISKEEIYRLILDKRYFRGFVWNKIYKTEIIKKYNIRFDNDIFIGEDYLFNCKYIEKCNKISYTNQKLYHYVCNYESVLHKALDKKHLTIIKAYDKIVKIYKDVTPKNLKYLYISYIKICCNIIYRNTLIKEKLDIKSIYIKRKEIMSIIMKTDIKLFKKVEVLIYYLFPVLIGKMRKILKKY